MRTLLLVTLFAVMMAQEPKQTLSPQLYNELSGKTDPIAEALKGMREDLSRFKSQHNDLFLELRDLNHRVDDMQRELNRQQLRMDAADPSKAAERLVTMELFVDGEKQRAKEERESSARQWAAVWAVSRYFGGALCAILFFELRQWVAGHRFRLTVEKAIAQQAAPAELVVPVVPPDTNQG